MGNTLQETNYQLTTAFKNNNQKVMQMVYQNTFPKFRNHVLKNSGDETQAKDVFQEAFIACWKNIKANKLQENSNVVGYLFTIAKNKWTDHLRSSTFKKTLVSSTIPHLKVVYEENDTDEEVLEKQYDILQSALQKLGNNCKKLLHLFYFERKSMDSISMELQLTPASTRNQKYRCMEKLRALSHELKNNG
nr:sigma-70 family RNA polymerase sigma factor [uncultured Allomuricauda sp.]